MKVHTKHTQGGRGEREKQSVREWEREGEREREREREKEREREPSKIYFLAMLYEIFMSFGLLNVPFSDLSIFFKL